MLKITPEVVANFEGDTIDALKMSEEHHRELSRIKSFKEVKEAGVGVGSNDCACCELYPKCAFHDIFYRDYSCPLLEEKKCCDGLWKESHKVIFVNLSAFKKAEKELADYIRERRLSIERG